MVKRETIRQLDTGLKILWTYHDCERDTIVIWELDKDNLLLETGVTDTLVRFGSTLSGIALDTEGEEKLLSFLQGRKQEREA